MQNNYEEIEVPLTEDLMREHGILNRILLIYEHIIHKITHHEQFSLQALKDAVEIIRVFIESHHERMEEDYIFPLFEKHHKDITLITTLKEQHIKSRELTFQLGEIITSSKIDDRTVQLKIKHILQEFIVMYRAHEAREDTEVFPLVRSFLTEEEFKKLSDIFENFEHQLLGNHGLEKIMKKIKSIEKNLGIIFE